MQVHGHHRKLIAGGIICHGPEQYSPEPICAPLSLLPRAAALPLGLMLLAWRCFARHLHGARNWACTPAFLLEDKPAHQVVRLFTLPDCGEETLNCAVVGSLAQGSSIAMNKTLLTWELRRIEARAAKTASLIDRQRTVVARLRKAGGPAVPEAHRLLRVLEDLHAMQHDRQWTVGTQLLLLTVKLLRAH